MNEAGEQSHDQVEAGGVGPGIMARAVAGGVLMGLANLVPGISGGTMLLAAGIYPRFIRAVADVTTLRFRMSSIVTLGCVAVAAGLAILLLAGMVRDLVVDHRWIMYSLFIGLTLGGVPLVWKMARPATAGVWISAAVAFVLMAVMAFAGAGASGDESNIVMSFAAGLAGASAMILPGISGGYLLLLLGQYTAILSTIDRLKEALKATDVSGIMAEMDVVIPLGLGVVVGVAGISNLLKWMLDRHQKVTLGFLLGLLFGSVVGLWPFQEPVEPVTGDVIKGEVVSAETIAEIEREDWALAYFRPTGIQIAASLGLIGAGLVTTLLIAHLGGSREEESAAPPGSSVRGG